MADKVISTEEAYACTTTLQDLGPCGRNILHLSRVGADDGDNVVKYGQEVRFVTNPYIFHKPLYLHSTQCTPQVFARFSRNQEVCLSSKPVFNTVWRIIPSDGEASTLMGTPVQPNTALIIEHCATREYLSNDKINYGNQFGTEFEVSAKRYTVMNKGQQLFNETVGFKTIDYSNKKVTDQNIWQILTAQDPSLAAPLESAPTVSYNAPSLIKAIREALAKKGAHTIRGLARAFKIMDDNQNR
jgi:hypothetical protein